MFHIFDRKGKYVSRYDTVPNVCKLNERLIDLPVQLYRTRYHCKWYGAAHVKVINLRYKFKKKTKMMLAKHRIVMK